MSEVLTLYELNTHIRSVVDAAFPETLLVTAEIASCDVKNHCYLSLVDKEEDVIRAEIKAVIWANRYKLIAPAFEKAAGTKLTKGIRILFQATVSFHERYGLKLTINNIDPSYTIGELAVRRKEVLARLEKEDLKDRNREREFPLIPQRIGIISSATAAGYEDFMSQLNNNSYGYKFMCRLYEAVMQGDNAESSIVRAINQCMEAAHELDVVVIVRGGGGQVDLHCFDSYEIGRAIALLPLPVISGIGHERDITVVDEVSHMRAKTPTAVADIIVTRIKEFEDRIDSLSNTLVHGTLRMASDMKEAVSMLSKRLEVVTRNELLENSHTLSTLMKGVRYALKLIQNEMHLLKARNENIKHLDPKNVLGRGYSITYAKSKIIKSISDVEKGDTLKTILLEGELLSRVENKKKGGRR